MKNLAIFASGTGSNFMAIYNAIKNGEIKANLSLLVTDKPNSKALEKAKQFNIDYIALSPRNFNSKEEYETEILEVLLKKNIDLIILAGYMRLIGDTLLSRYPHRIINIHPSLLPLFKGKDAIGQAINAQVNYTGVSVHYVDQGMDTGQIIMQEVLDISEITSREEIEERIHQIEHKLYPKVINKLLEDMS